MRGVPTCNIISIKNFYRAEQRLLSSPLRRREITDRSGDVANITVTLQNTDYATVTIGSDDVGFRSNVTVEDENGDGEVNFLFNTWAATDATNVRTTGSRRPFTSLFFRRYGPRATATGEERTVPRPDAARPRYRTSTVVHRLTRPDRRDPRL
jgi:hypothetical protein